MANFLYGLNTSTIQPAPLLDKIRIAREVGYDAIELWVTDVEAYLAAGHPLSDVQHALDDAGLVRPSMIFLKGWCEADPKLLAEGLDTCRRRLEIARDLEVQRMVAGPPHGNVSLPQATDAYGRLLELSLEFEVPASIEFLGFVEAINTLEAAWAICQGVNHPDATLTNDAWHLFRGGSDLATVNEIPPERVSIVHWDDAPRHVERAKQTDADRVMPGDGILDLYDLAQQLTSTGYCGVLSLELFHPGYWEQDPREVARIGLEKMRNSVEA
jgi:sugar phosphate isomerase/epimerase